MDEILICMQGLMSGISRKTVLPSSMSFAELTELATVFGWMLATFAVRPFKRLAQQTSQIDAGDEPPNIEVRGATEAVEIADAVKGMLERIWEEQGRTKAALASARDFSNRQAL